MNRRIWQFFSFVLTTYRVLTIGHNYLLWLCEIPLSNRRAVHTCNHIIQPLIFKKYITCYNICRKAFNKQLAISLHPSKPIQYYYYEREHYSFNCSLQFFLKIILYSFYIFFSYNSQNISLWINSKSDNISSSIYILCVNNFYVFIYIIEKEQFHVQALHH